MQSNVSSRYDVSPRMPTISCQSRLLFLPAASISWSGSRIVLFALLGPRLPKRYSSPRQLGIRIRKSSGRSGGGISMKRPASAPGLPRKRDGLLAQSGYPIPEPIPLLDNTCSLMREGLDNGSNFRQVRTPHGILQRGKRCE